MVSSHNPYSSPPTPEIRYVTRPAAVIAIVILVSLLIVTITVACVRESRHNARETLLEIYVRQQADDLYELSE